MMIGHPGPGILGWVDLEQLGLSWTLVFVHTCTLGFTVHGRGNVRVKRTLSG